MAITACPTGIAHTYMAADSLAQAGDEMGVPVKVETQGSSATTPLPPEVIKNATGVIFATDVGVKGRERFAGLPVVASGVKRAINEPKKMIEEALAHAENPNGPRVEAGAGGGAESAAAGAGGDVGFGTRLRQVLMTGVSYMIPFVAAGGLLIALGFLIGGYSIPFVADNVLTQFSPTNLPTVDALVKLAEEGGSALSQESIAALPSSGFLLYLGAALFKLGGLAFGQGGVWQLGASDAFIEVGAAIGFALLLLMMGLEYSADELTSNLRQGLRPSLLDLVLNAAPGVVCGVLLGWEPIAWLALGAVTYISSSGVIAKVIADLDRTANRETPVVLSLLVSEDLVMAVFLPVLAGLLVGGSLVATGVSVAVALAAVGVTMLVAVRTASTSAASSSAAPTRCCCSRSSA